ncbi:hypothetical protein [Rhizobium sp. RU36D]|uniref:hypothetical protein n=1 Tax=Rhizobium sp. RU36D TaxID=1907415 RepID=UPI000A03B993|nr:hypothetical protein [Rhizobium sp. RU36D]
MRVAERLAMKQIRSRQGQCTWYARWVDAFVLTVFVSILSLVGGTIGRDIGLAAANPSSIAGPESGKIHASAQTDSRMLMASDQSNRHKARPQPPLDDCLLPDDFALVLCRHGQVRQQAPSFVWVQYPALAYRSRAPPLFSI